MCIDGIAIAHEIECIEALRCVILAFSKKKMHLETRQITHHACKLIMWHIILLCYVRRLFVVNVWLFKEL